MVAVVADVEQRRSSPPGRIEVNIAAAPPSSSQIFAATVRWFGFYQAGVSIRIGQVNSRLICSSTCI